MREGLSESFWLRESLSGPRRSAARGCVCRLRRRWETPFIRPPSGCGLKAVGGPPQEGESALAELLIVDVNRAHRQSSTSKPNHVYHHSSKANGQRLSGPGGSGEK